METFSGRFWKIPGNVLKLELLKMLIDHKNASVFFQAVFLRFFLQINPIPMRKKTAAEHPFIVLLVAGEEKNKPMFFRLFFRLRAHFSPHSSAIFHPNTHIIFCCPLSAYDKWWFEQKKSPHFREKYLVLSYLKAGPPCGYFSHVWS